MKWQEAREIFIGVPLDQLNKIFGRNYRYDRAGEDKGLDGIGLGLVIYRGIVQAHGRTVRAESDGKTGLIIYISLPCISGEGR